jgi:hypothetical protein
VRHAATALAVALLAGCGGGADPAALTAEEVAEAWVAAINDRDWSEACALSVQRDHAACERLVATSFGPVAGRMRLEGTFAADAEGAREELTFAVSPSEPAANLAVERHGERRLVHFEVQVLR